MGDTVLVTGGSGFIGSHLIKALLDRGDRVINYDRGPHSGPMAWFLRDYLERIDFERGSVEDSTALQSAIRRHRVNKLAHLAASIDLDQLMHQPRIAHDVMITGTVNALEAARLLGIERFVFFSSIGVLPTRQYEPIDCNHPLLLAGEGPANGVYGAAKIAGEALCWAYRVSCNLDFVIIRPSAVYGFFTQNPIYLPQFVIGALAGQPVHFAHGGLVPRDYTHVADVAGISAAALNAPSHRLKDRCFYAATGKPLVTASQCAELVQTLVPGADLSISPVLDAYDEMELPFRGILDISSVEDQLGYRLQYPELLEGIAEFIGVYSDFLRCQGKIPARVRGLPVDRDLVASA